MKRIVTLLPLTLIAMLAFADSTDWLNFATGKGGTVVKSIQFKAGGKLYFDDANMRYVDSNETSEIPYTGGKYIFFSAESGIGSPIAESNSNDIKYDADAQTISVEENVSNIKLISMQGSVLRSANNTNEISTVGIQPQVVVVVITNDLNIATKKFFIK